jgi:phosphohistidine phosphatase
MRLYLVQHGASTSEAEDPLRPLSPEGRHNVQKLAAHISQFSLAIDLIEHSDKLRAKQTAEVFALQLRPALGVRQAAGLAPNDPVEPIVNRLRKEPKEVMLVGHLPHLSRLAHALLGLKSEGGSLRFQMGGCVCMESDDAGKWAVCWMLTPDLLPDEDDPSHPSGIWAMET